MPTALVVGCGVFGLSTALELAQNGYRVTALDAYPVPSPWSAANDFNKIIRAEYSKPEYVKLSLEAIEQWRSDPKFKHTYNECGRIINTPKSQTGRREFEEIGIQNIQKLGWGKGIETIVGGRAIGSKFPELAENQVDEAADVKWNPESGLAHAANSLKGVYEATSELGVKFQFGEAGHAIKIEVNDGKTRVVTADGQKHTADIVVVSAGAATGNLVDLGNLQSATGLFVTHIQLTSEEYTKYKNMPIVFDSELGYFFPPDPETHILKVCLSGLGVSHPVLDPFDATQQRSLPRYKLQNPQDTIPSSGPQQARKLLQKYVPELAQHNLFKHKVCWIADTSESNFIVDSVPGYTNLYVATGDSGHAFKFLPNIGKYIRQKLEGLLEPKLVDMWRWKDMATNFNAGVLPWRVLKKTLNINEVIFIEDT